MPRKLKTTTFRKTQHKKKPRKSYKKTNAKTYRRRKVVGGVKEEVKADGKAKKATSNAPKLKTLPPAAPVGIKRSPKKDDLKSYGEKALSKDVVGLADLLAKLNNDSK